MRPGSWAAPGWGEEKEGWRALGWGGTSPQFTGSHPVPAHRSRGGGGLLQGRRGRPWGEGGLESPAVATVVSLGASRRPVGPAQVCPGTAVALYAPPPAYIGHPNV